MRKIALMIVALLFAGRGYAQQEGVKFVSQSNAEFAKTISDKNVQLVDVRRADEFAQGHIPSAVNIDVSAPDFDEKVAEKLDKTKSVALYCRSGGRSKTAARRLSAAGYKVYELDKGFMNWDGKSIK